MCGGNFMCSVSMMLQRDVITFRPQLQMIRRWISQWSFFFFFFFFYTAAAPTYELAAFFRERYIYIFIGESNLR